MESKKDTQKKEPHMPGRMEYDVEDTSRTMKPGHIKGSSTSSQNSTSSPKIEGSGSTTNIKSSQGRGWHGDSDGHAKAGSQSHKNSGKKKS